MNTPLNVLLIEDNPGDARLIQAILKQTCGDKVRAAWVDRLGAGLERIAEGGIDLVLLDLSLPDSQGAETFTRVRAAVPQVAIVVLTGTKDEVLAVTAVKEGAQDYLVKDGLDGELLSRSLRYAFERHRMLGKLKRLTLLEERARIARDIHDGAIQTLFGVGMVLKDVASILDDAEQASRIGGAVHELGRLSRDLREFIFSLKPARLSGMEIDEALRELAEDVYGKTGLSVKTDIDPLAADLVGEHGRDLLQIAREALANVVKHAGAGTAMVRLEQHGDLIVFSIEDDGRGIGQRPERRQGLGMRNLRERAAVLGGTLTATDRPDGGTRVCLRIPLTVLSPTEP